MPIRGAPLSPTALQGPVLIFCSRILYRDEAAWFAPRLREKGCTVRFVDADLTARDELPETTAAAQERASPGATLLRNWPTARNAASIVLFIRMRRRLNRLLEAEKPAAVVVFDDRQLQPEAIAVQTAAMKGIPVVQLPYAWSSHESDLFLRRAKRGHSAAKGRSCLLSRLAAMRYPAQVSDETLFYPASVTLALGALGLLPAKPWSVGASGPDIVCALGPDHAAYISSGGVPHERIVVTGQATTDPMWISAAEKARLLAHLRTKYQITEGKSIAVCAVPQHAEHGMASWESHREKTRVLFRALSQINATVLLSLHPKSRKEDYEEAAREYGLAVLSEKLSGVLPIANLLIATFSSTVRWAAQLGIPSLIIDDLSTGFQAFRDLPGVTAINSQDDICAVANKLIDAKTKADDRASSQERQAAVGQIDGRSSNRIAAAIIQAARRKIPADAEMTDRYVTPVDVDCGRN